MRFSLQTCMIAATAIICAVFSGPFAGAETQCRADLLERPALPPGTVLEVRTTINGSTIDTSSLRKISETRDAVTTLEYKPFRRSRNPEPPFRDYVSTFAYLGGLLNLEDNRRPFMGSFRTREYLDDPISEIRGLRPGEKVELNSIEASRFSREFREIEAPVTVTFLGCETMEVAGEIHDIVVFDVSKTMRAYNSTRRTDRDRISNTRKYYSLDIGWVVRTEDSQHNFNEVKKIY